MLGDAGGYGTQEPLNAVVLNHGSVSSFNPLNSNKIDAWAMRVTFRSLRTKFLEDLALKFLSLIKESSKGLDMVVSVLLNST